MSENNKTVTEKCKNIIRFSAPIIIGAFFCFLCFFYGVREYPDSVTYIYHYTEREPVYVLFLQLIRAVFTEQYYLQAACVIQNVIAAIITWYLYRTIQRRFAMPFLMEWIVLAVLLLPHLLSGVLSSSGMILTNSILSEGITYSLYQLFAAYLLNLMWTKENKYAVLSLLTAFVESITRSQLMPLLLVYLIVEFVILIKGQKSKRILKVGIVLLSVVAAFGLRGLCIRTNNYIQNGKFIGMTSGGATILTNVLYSSDRDSLDRISDELTEEEYFRLSQVFDDIEEQQLGYRDAGEGIIAHISHHEDAHDRIKFGRLEGTLRRLAESELYGYNYDEIVAGTVEDYTYPDPEEVDEKVDEIAMRYAKLLLRESLTQYAITYIYVAIGGFIRTVGLLRPAFIIYTAALFVILIVMLIAINRIHCKTIVDQEEKKNAQDVCSLIVISLLMTCANVFATSLTIMCLNRYMIYNTGLIYLSLLLGGWQIWVIIRKGMQNAAHKETTIDTQKEVHDDV